MDEKKIGTGEKILDQKIDLKSFSQKMDGKNLMQWAIKF